MKKSTTIMLIAFIGISIVACQKPAQGKPDDFSFTYHWDTGSLPPQFHYAYTVTVDARGNGQVFDQRGNGDTANLQSWMVTFQVSTANMEEVYQLLQSRDFFRAHWTEEEPLVGGQWCTLELTANGKVYNIPSDASLQKVDRDAVAEVSQVIRQLIPPSIWDEIYVRRLPDNSAPGT